MYLSFLRIPYHNLNPNFYLQRFATPEDILQKGHPVGLFILVKLEKVGYQISLHNLHLHFTFS